MLKDNKGITLSALVITIIVLIIIASIAAISGISATHYIKYQNAKSQFQVVQSKIDSLYSEYNNLNNITEKENWKNDKFAGVIKYSDFANKLDSSIVSQTLDGLTIDSTNQDNYMYLSADFIKNNLQLDGITYNFIVNLDEREVRLYGGVEYQNKMYYSAKDFGIETIEFDGIGKWFYKKDSNGRKTIVTNKKLELKIGDYINYNAAAKDAEGKTIVEKTITSNAGSPTDTGEDGYYKASEKTLTEGNGYGPQTFSNKAKTNGWRVLGANEETGELLIISADSVLTTENAIFYLRGIAGYNYGEQELNKVCSVFGSGYGATGARSVNVDDINKITGYNPNNVGKYDPEQKTTGTKYGKDQPYEYGNQITYAWTSTANKILGSGSNGKSSTDSNSNYEKNGFNWYDVESKTWKNLKQDTTTPAIIATLTSTHYYYYPDSLNISSGEGEGLTTISEEYKTLFMNRAGSRESYLLASLDVDAYYDGAVLGMRCVRNCFVYYSSLYKTNGNVGTPGYGVRPVVSLKSNIRLEKQSDGSYNIK